MRLEKERETEVDIDGRRQEENQKKGEREGREVMEWNYIAYKTR